MLQRLTFIGWVLVLQYVSIYGSCHISDNWAYGFFVVIYLAKSYADCHFHLLFKPWVTEWNRLGNPPDLNIVLPVVKCVGFLWCMKLIWEPYLCAWLSLWIIAYSFHNIITQLASRKKFTNKERRRYFCSSYWSDSAFTVSLPFQLSRQCAGCGLSIYVLNFVFELKFFLRSCIIILQSNCSVLFNREPWIQFSVCS